MHNLFSQAALGWLGRRAVEVGGLVTLLVNLYNALPPQHQETIVAVLTGKGGGLTVGAVLGLGLWLWSQFMSFRATTRPQIVTDDGVKVDTKKQLPRNKKVLVEEMANAADAKKKAERKPGLLDKLFGRTG